MTPRPRFELRASGGFTMVELLVVLLIIGLLSAIAVPSFLNQRTKAQDAEAKVYLVAAQKALEIWHSQRDTYDGADQAALARIEPAIGRARNLTITGDDDTFDMAADSASGAAGGGRFTLAKGEDRVVRRSCTAPGRGACPDGGTW